MWSSCQIRCCTHQRYASLMITEFTLQELGCPRAVSVCSFFLEPDVGDSGAGSPFSQLLTWALHIDSKAISPTNRLTRGGLKGNRDVLYHPGHTTTIFTAQLSCRTTASTGQQFLPLANHFCSSSVMAIATCMPLYQKHSAYVL